MMAAPRDRPPQGEDPADDSPGPAPARTQRPAMHYRIAPERGYLRAELAHCETADEMRAFLTALVRSSAQCGLILLQVRASKPLFNVERGGLIGFLRQIARAPRHRIALLADTPDLQSAHEYLELIARQRGVRARSFRSEGEALAWLADRRDAPDRRQGGERRAAQAPAPRAIERRQLDERRRGERRAAA